MEAKTVYTAIENGRVSHGFFEGVIVDYKIADVPEEIAFDMVRTFPATFSFDPLVDAGKPPRTKQPPVPDSTPAQEA